MKKAKRRCINYLVDQFGNIVYYWFGGFKR